MKKLFPLIESFGLRFRDCYSRRGPSDAIFKKAIQEDKFYIKPSRQTLAQMSQASTIVISCVDFRFRDELEQLMKKHFDLQDDYDEVVLPGASLALVFKGKEHWGQTILDIIALLKKLHGIYRIVFVDHRDCGAYRIAHENQSFETPEIELAYHKDVMLQAKKKIHDTLPELNLEVYGLLLGFDGVVDNLKI